MFFRCIDTSAQKYMRTHKVQVIASLPITRDVE